MQVVVKHSMPYHLLGLISMTPALWVFLAVQGLILLLAVVACILPMRTREGSNWLVGASVAGCVLSVVVSVLTVAAGFLESFAATGPANEKAAQLASGMLTIMNGALMGVPFAALLATLMAVQLTRRARRARERRPSSSP